MRRPSSKLVFETISDVSHVPAHDRPQALIGHAYWQKWCILQPVGRLIDMVRSSSNNSSIGFPRATAAAVIQLFLEKACVDLETLRGVMLRLGVSVDDVLNDDGTLNFLRLGAANLKLVYFQMPVAHQEFVNEQSTARFDALVAERREKMLLESGELNI